MTAAKMGLGSNSTAVGSLDPHGQTHWQFEEHHDLHWACEEPAELAAASTMVGVAVLASDGERRPQWVWVEGGALALC
jgi:hypothetical protein